MYFLGGPFRFLMTKPGIWIIETWVIFLHRFMGGIFIWSSLKKNLTWLKSKKIQLNEFDIYLHWGLKYRQFCLRVDVFSALFVCIFCHLFSMHKSTANWHNGIVIISVCFNVCTYRYVWEFKAAWEEKLGMDHLKIMIANL